MPLTISEVHVLTRDTKTNQMIVQRTQPYTRLVQQGEPPVIVQGGNFYSDGGDRMPLSSVPDWALKQLSNRNKKSNASVGLPEDFDISRIKEVPEEPAPIVGDLLEDQIEEEEVEQEEIDEPVNMPPKTLVDYIYELDQNNDEHWNSDGKPSLKAIQNRAGEYFSRGAIEEAAPGYVRKGVDDGDS